MQKAIFEIFRSGFHSKGGGISKTVNWTQEDLKGMAQFYSEKIRPVPLTIGHPENDEPKLGTVKRVIHHDNSLFAEAEVAPELAQRIKNGEFSGISVAILGKGHSKNPVGELGYYLKHVGFLEKGKDSPAVGGMLNPEISMNVFQYNRGDEIFMFCEDERPDLTETERLDAKIGYFQTVMNTDYQTAFNIVINQP